MSSSALQLSARDFDAYAPEKATSNAYSRPRLEVKQRAVAWARDVAARLAALGIAVEVEASDEHPTLRNKKRVDCQWVVFWRDAAARDELDRLLDRGRSISAAIGDPDPHTRHAFLALRIDAGAIQVCFTLHPNARVDLDNLKARLDAGDALVAELMDAMVALPEEFAIGTSGDRGEAPADRVACSAATPEVISAVLDRALAGAAPLWIGWTVERQAAIDHAEILADQLGLGLVALAPIYELVAWSKKNDRIQLEAKLEGVEQERAKAHADALASTEKWRAEKAEAQKRSQELAQKRAEEKRADVPGAAKPTLASLFKPPATARREPEAKIRASARKPEPAPRTPALAPRADVAAPPPLAAGEATGRIEIGAQVGVLRGPFAGKVGVVTELDARGGARVHLGLLSTRLALADLEAVLVTRDRPALQTNGSGSALQSSHARLPRKAR